MNILKFYIKPISIAGEIVKKKKQTKIIFIIFFLVFTLFINYTGLGSLRDVIWVLYEDVVPIFLFSIFFCLIWNIISGWYKILDIIVISILSVYITLLIHLVYLSQWISSFSFWDPLSIDKIFPIMNYWIFFVALYYLWSGLYWVGNLSPVKTGAIGVLCLTLSFSIFSYIDFPVLTFIISFGSNPIF